MRKTLIGKKFRFVKLVIGALAIGFGAGLTAYNLFVSNAIYIAAFALSLLAIAVGIVAVAHPFDLACKKCNAFLKTHRVHIASETSDQFVDAISQGATQRIADLLDSTAVPLYASAGDTRTLMEFEICETCKYVARFELKKVTYNQSGQAGKSKRLLGWHELRGPAIAKILELSGARNQKQLEIYYQTLTNNAAVTQ